MKNSIYERLLSKPKIATTTLSALLMLCLTACEKSNHILTSGGGHEIRAVVAGDPSIDSQSDRALISSPYAKVTVERARVKINDAPWTAIPESVPVEVKLAKGKVSLKAGPVTVGQTY